MARIQVGGAGGAPANNFIRSIRSSGRDDFLIGQSCVPSDLMLADVDERHVILPATAPGYREAMLTLLKRTRPDFLHLQHDFEVRAISRMRDEIAQLGVKLYLPDPQTVENCVDKRRSYEIWRASGIRVPETMLLNGPADVDEAFRRLGKKIWIRAIEGGGGRGALPTDSISFSRAWIDHFGGWGSFTASELLTEQSVTWLSVWDRGNLVVAQQRRRRSWNFGDRTLSGVTGITGVAETSSSPEVDEIAQKAIHAIDQRPHGVFGVDLTYDQKGVPNPTEINIGRFFTTVYFFTKAGLNMPAMYCDIALGRRVEPLAKKINPLPDGLVWIRGMDVEPVLTTVQKLEELEKCTAEHTHR